MSAEEEMAAGKKGYEKGLGAMSAEARTAGYDESWEKQYAVFKYYVGMPEYTSTSHI